MGVLAMTLAIICFIAGLAGSVLPVLPGAILIWAGMLVYGILTKFTTLNTFFFIGQALAVSLVYAVDYLVGMVGVKKFGGSRNAVYGSFAGAILGIIIMGPAGIIFGPFIGAIVGELLNKQKLNIAVRSGIGTLVGLLGGTLVKLVIEAAMIFWFFWAVLV
ncbi:DUF456 family protein [Desulfallas sp. Bu1-1]|uniref:DUF456 domain-containing protein n=1 Tax=Desulfallas sp. Bu1-1 TaxID=2787620 RepID=UPI00189D0741|nr:DUF456 family protein [Desulfallas sp. Bu1-1]MBF7084110.1 DUF456 family protein [Desulfallas sp. Bu1-1]